MKTLYFLLVVLLVLMGCAEDPNDIPDNPYRWNLEEMRDLSQARDTIYRQHPTAKIFDGGKGKGEPYSSLGQYDDNNAIIFYFMVGAESNIEPNSCDVFTSVIVALLFAPTADSTEYYYRMSDRDCRIFRSDYSMPSSGWKPEPRPDISKKKCGGESYRSYEEAYNILLEYYKKMKVEVKENLACHPVAVMPLIGAFNLNCGIKSTQAKAVFNVKISAGTLCRVDKAIINLCRNKEPIEEVNLLHYWSKKHCDSPRRYGKF